MTECNQNENNGQWKGNLVKYNALHGWIRRHLPKPKICSICSREKKLELSCIDHKYTRDLKQWLYMCRSCHSAIDKKVLNIVENRKIKKCPKCGIEIESVRNYCESCSRKVRLLWWKEYNHKRRHPS